MRSRYPYPIETLRHWYVAPFGGCSSDLELGQVGLNRDALADNTDLIPFEDRVSISRLDGDKTRPLFLKRYFEVIALDRRSLDALSKSPNGEIVLPLEDLKQRRGLLEPFNIGELIVLNGVLSQRIPREFGRS